MPSPVPALIKEVLRKPNDILTVVFIFTGDPKELDIIRAMMPHRVLVAFTASPTQPMGQLPPNATLLDGSSRDEQLPVHLNPELIVSLYRPNVATSAAQLSAGLHIPMALIFDGPPSRELRAGEAPPAHAGIFCQNETSLVWLWSPDTSHVVGDDWSGMSEAISNIANNNFWNVWE
jgi:hypothetical protein